MSRFRKLSASVLLVLVSLSALLGSFSFPPPAHAQVIATIATDIPGQIKDILLQIWEILKTAVLNAVIRLVTYVIRKVSYDAAVWLASGGKGQGALAFNKGFGSYMSDVGNEAFGAAIESLADKRTGIGLNLCKIPDIKVDLAMKVGLRMPGFGGFGGRGGDAGQQKPSCSFTEFTKNWGDAEAHKSRWSGFGNDIQDQFNSAMSSADQTDFGIYLGTKQLIDQTVAVKMAGEELQRLEGGGAKPVAGIISDQIKLPAGNVKKELESNTPSTQQEKDEQQIAALLSKGDIKVLPTILSIFVNTLVSTMVKNYQEQGVLPFGIGCKDGSSACLGGGGAAAYESTGVVGGRRQAQIYFESILQTALIKPIDNYDLTGELAACPDGLQNTYNCRADQKLVEALKQTEVGSPTTIAAALKSGALDGSKQLLPPTRVAENMDKKCFEKSYCYANIRVLRQIRVLPLGFEIAAKLSDPDRPWTLEQVVKGFNDCLRDEAGNIIYDPVNKPFCHLIDPNWVLKLEPTRCNASVWGPQPLSEGIPQRNQDCADLSTCVAFDIKGQCVSYAYCTREKNTWKFDADECPAEFRTCRTFNNSETNQSASYIYRTLDTGWCSAQNVGCNYFSLTKLNGGWQGPGQNAGVNNGIYFNKSVSESCSPNSQGCSAFAYASSTDITLFLKKAPEYLGCYDADKVALGVQWPDTPVELRQLPASPACSQYSSACIKSEVGCNLYTPLSGDRRPIPGKYGVDNLCDASCVGYDSYREMPSNFSGGQDVAYIIPSSGEACAPADAGCTGFTNVGNITGDQVEQVDYFTHLRACVPSSVNTGKNFITYESTALTGIQLKTYRLVENIAVEDNLPIINNPNNQIGAPKYLYGTLADRQKFADLCSEAVYKAQSQNPTFDPDCRQFNDDRGRVFYRLLSRLIPVTDSCQRYRLNNTELYNVPAINENTCTEENGIYHGFWNKTDNICQVCFQSGEYKDGQCYYYGLPKDAKNSAGESRACAETANSCREYKGNAGNNVKVMADFPNTFELSDIATNTPALLKDWAILGGSISITRESTQPAGQSLGYSGAGQVFKKLELASGNTYILSFWAKGSGVATDIRLDSADGLYTKAFGTLSLGDTWNYYSLGPVELTPNGNNPATTNFRLAFALTQNGSIYLDNVRLVEVAENIFIKKNTLKVSSACDDNTDDNLPGAALGCRAYSNPVGQRVNLTGFSFLCRENAIGCVGVIDSFNTLGDTGERYYNIWMPGLSGAWKTLDLKLGQKNPKCQIEVGRSGCYIKTVPAEFSLIAIQNGGGTVVTSTVTVPADTSSTAPIFLVANKGATCTEPDLGCMYAGKLKDTPTGPEYVTTTIKNSPAEYNDQLCYAEALFCGQYKDNAGGDFYFKDPLQSGQGLCQYRADVDVKVRNIVSKNSGWFREGVGYCKKSSALCVKNTDCGGGDSCDLAANVPCYPSYLDADGVYGLWSYGATSTYQNFVGSCPDEWNQCTEFVDHADNDERHYFINNKKISAGDCAGQASQKYGCALFEKTDNPNKYWSTDLSYKNSENKDGNLVPAASDPNGNDSNIIIQVKQDRMCGEWIQCVSSHTVRDQNTGNFKKVCDQVARCDRALPSKAKGSYATCAHWVTYKINDPPPRVLDESVYVTRNVGWTGQDYSGYSLLNTLPIETLRQININNPTSTPAWRLVKVVACGGDKSIGGDKICVNKSPTSTDSACVPSDLSECDLGGEFNVPCKELAPCGTAAQPGVCARSGVCVATPGGLPDVRLMDSAPSQICRAYPEQDSPFPNQPSIAKATNLFKGVNYCNEGNLPSSWKLTANLCECNYTRAQYGDFINKFWNYARPNQVPIVINSKNSKIPLGILGNQPGEVPKGLCQGGDRDGMDCEADRDCHKIEINKDNIFEKDKGDISSIDGACQKLKRVDPHLGWSGYCLEPDISRPLNGLPSEHPCLTWWPVDTLNGAADVNNQHTDAGYQGAPLYCLASNGAGNGKVVDWETPADPDGTSAKNFYTRRMGIGLGILSSRGTAPWENDNLGQFSRSFVQPVDNEIGVIMEDVERIDFKVTSGDSQDPANDATFSIWPNDPNKNKTVYQSYYRAITIQGGGANDNAYRPGVAVAGKYMGRGTDWVIAYSSAHKHEGSTFPYIFTSPSDGIPNDAQPNTPGTVGDFCYAYNGQNKNSCNAFSGNIFGSKMYASGVELPSQENNGSENIGIWSTRVKGSQICPSGAKDDAPHQECNSLPGRCGGNWHAIRVRFDPATHAFLGYYTAYCDDSPGSGSVGYHVFFKFKEWCKSVVSAKVNYTDPISAVAWTDRLWIGNANKSQYVVSNLKYDKDNNGNLTLVNYTTKPEPFGALATGNPADKFETILFTKADKIGKDPKDASKYQCPPNVGECNYDKLGEVYRDTGDKNKSVLLTPGYPYSCKDGLGGACPGYDGDKDVNLITNAIDFAKVGVGITGRTNVIQLFAKVFDIYDFNGSQYLTSGLAPTFNITRTGLNGVTPKAPTVYAVNCAEADQDANCIEGAPGAISVNNTSTGDIYLFGDYAERATTRFYAAAYKEQMPIRQIKVDWGDGMVTDPGLGAFRNQRGQVQTICSAPDKVTPGNCKTPSGAPVLAADGTTKLSCSYQNPGCPTVSQCVPENSAAEFGLIVNRSCDNSYFQFEHDYQCVKGDKTYHPSSSDCGRLPERFPEGCCIYKPRVQVKDNWGWCAGSCLGNVGSGCYDGNDGAGPDQCADPNSPLPWVNFGGKLYVKPTE
ncbi:MAG: hypothetical protein Q7K39_04390 [Candidatus Magasanikbacteria bacterium]|nr:hypothetical protein [Candidatus Magasanikbacteria bacterium]